MLSPGQAQPPIAAAAPEPAAEPPEPAVPAPWSRRPWDRVSLLWRVFAANTVVFVVSVALLAWTPVTVHRVATPGELLVLVLGLVLMLAVDLVLLHRTFAPLRRLAAVMGEVDPGQPGRRAESPAGAGREVVALARALNAMLDRLEGERRESRRRALAAQEGERTRVARELHDEVGQTLTAIALRAERAATEPAAHAEALTEIAESVLRSLEDVHRIGRELRPEALDDLGLVNALIALCSRVDRQGGLRVRRELDWHLPALSPQVELVIYRVVQEALTNVLRHAQATEVSVRVSNERGDVVLAVTDNGLGLPARVTESGLSGMRERAMLIDAELEIRSGAAHGTQILLRVPGGSSPRW
jgi:two-component system, NarL family, sensor histidine kinase UhpB